MITSLILALGLSTSPTEVSPINITPSTPSLEARTFRNSRINNELEARTFRNSRI